MSSSLSCKSIDIVFRCDDHTASGRSRVEPRHLAAVTDETLDEGQVESAHQWRVCLRHGVKRAVAQSYRAVGVFRLVAERAEPFDHVAPGELFALLAGRRV